MPVPEARSIVINTGPIIALSAGLGSLDLLRCYARVVVPSEVFAEVMAGGMTTPGAAELDRAGFLDIRVKPVEPQPWIANSLDCGEASVVHTALEEGIRTVCIDELFGRRVARLAGLHVTGSVGILCQAVLSGTPLDLAAIRARMDRHNVWIADRIWETAIALVAGDTQ